MGERLTRLISDYQARVSAVVSLLEAAGVQRPATAEEWMLRRDVRRGSLPGGVQFMKHGRGLAAHSRRWSIDFDFGVHGEIDGFDPWRLWSFGGRWQGRYFETKAELHTAFQQAVDDHELVESDGIYFATPRVDTQRGPTPDHRMNQSLDLKWGMLGLAFVGSGAMHLSGWQESGVGAADIPAILGLVFCALGLVRLLVMRRRVDRKITAAAQSGSAGS